MAFEIGQIQPSILRHGAAMFAGQVLDRAGSLPVIGSSINQVVQEAREPKQFVGRLVAENLEDTLRKNYECLVALKDCAGDTSLEETELREQAGLASQALTVANACTTDPKHTEPEQLYDVIENVLPEITPTPLTIPAQRTRSD